MSEQSDLFTERPDAALRAPATGSDTSQAAAASVTPEPAARLRARVHRYIREHEPEGATADEMEVALGMPGNTLRPRLWELETKLGLVRRGTETRLTRSGRRAHPYHLTGRP